MIENDKYFIDLINSSKAYQFVSQYHYSHRGFKAAKINQGIFEKGTNKLVGVLQWGRSAAHNIKLDRYVTDDISIDEYLELNRFAMADSEGKNSESQAISLGLKWLRQYRKDIRLLVSYSGRVEGNYGYIYQATNWEYLGYFVSAAFWRLDGNEYHLTTVASRYKKYKDKYANLQDYVMAEYHDVQQYDSKQFIYVIRMDKKLHLASPPLPYPKPATEYPIQTNITVMKKNDDYAVAQYEEKDVEFYYDPNERLFTHACLRRRGEHILPRMQSSYFVIYDAFGKKKGEYNSIKEILSAYDFLSETSVRLALNEGKMHKGMYYKKIPRGKPCDERIEVKKPLCWIDDVPYFKQTEIAKAFGISRQAVSSSVKRKGKKICGHDVIWGDEDE